MTLAAAKKLILKLPPRQRVKFADTLYDSVPVLRGSVGIEELERRADEVISGKVKAVTWDEFQRDLDEMRKSIKPGRPTAAPRRGQQIPKSKARHSA